MKKKIKKFAEGGYQGREGQKALNLNTGKNRPEEITPNRSNSQDKGPYGEQFAKLFEGLRQDKGPYGEQFAKLFEGLRQDKSPYGEQSAKLFGMKHGGKVKGKKCRMDGIAIRGKTRAKERSK
jgi:hypothetical protein